VRVARRTHRSRAEVPARWCSIRTDVEAVK